MADIDELLIEEVRNNPIIYDVCRGDYRNVKKKENVWTTIAGTIGLPVPECQHRWKSLRDKYVREVKNLECRSGDEGKIREKWPLYEMLSFLRSFTKHKVSSGNLSTVTIDSSLLNTSDSLEIEQSACCSSLPVDKVTLEPSHLSDVYQETKNKKRKIDPLEKCIIEKLSARKAVSADEHFLMSLLPALESLPPEKKANVKLDMLKMLTEAQFPQLNKNE